MTDEWFYCFECLSTLGQYVMYKGTEAHRICRMCGKETKFIKYKEWERGRT